MRRTSRNVLRLCLLAGALAGCGSEAEGLSGLSAALYLPQDLAADLASVTIYAYETDRATKEPSCSKFLANTDFYDTVRARDQATIVIGTNDTATLELPHRGNVWRIYARGYSFANQFIAHGCIDGVIVVDPQAAAPTEVDLFLTRYPPP